MSVLSLRSLSASQLLPEDEKVSKSFTLSFDLPVQFGCDVDNVNLWIERSELLLKNHLPDLAAIDAYKAVLLAENPASSSDEYADTKLAATAVLARSLLGLDCFGAAFNLLHTIPEHHRTVELEELYDMANEALERRIVRKNINVDHYEIDQLRNKPALMNGKIKIVTYPWTEEEYLNRQTDTVNAITLAIIENSNGLCELKKKENGTDEEYGIYTTRPLSAGTVIASEYTKLSAVLPVKEVLCTICHLFVPLCESDTDRMIPGPCVHQFPAGYKQEYRTVPAELIKNVLLDVVKFVRNNPNKHPFEAPAVAGLKLNLGGTMNISFTENIEQPIKTLQAEGIDVFTDAKFDGHVLMTILGRVYSSFLGYTNKDAEITAVSPLANFLGDAAPGNVDFKGVADGEAAVVVTVVAGRALEAGEELVVAGGREIVAKDE